MTFSRSMTMSVEVACVMSMVDKDGLLTWPFVTALANRFAS